MIYRKQAGIASSVFWQFRKQIIIRLHWQNRIPLVPLGNPAICPGEVGLALELGLGLGLGVNSFHYLNT